MHPEPGDPGPPASTTGGASLASSDAHAAQTGGPAPSRPQEAEAPDLTVDGQFAVIEKGLQLDLAEGVRRNYATAAFDLHDGPQQDLILLGDDLGLLQEQLAEVLSENPVRDRILGHLQDLHARLAAVDADLRRISTLMVSPFLPDESFSTAFTSLIDDFTMRTQISPASAVRGDFDALTDSQRITLLALIQEALHNIVQHANARNVRITVTQEPGSSSTAPMRER